MSRIKRVIRNRRKRKILECTVHYFARSVAKVHILGKISMSHMWGEELDAMEDASSYTKIYLRRVCRG